MSDKAPEFDLPSLAGGRCTLAELLATGPVLLAFYKAACPTCQLTFPFLERLNRGLERLKGANRADGARVVAVSQDDVRATAAFNRNYGIAFTTLMDSEGYPASNAYRITNVPSLFLVEQDGHISQSVVGFEKAAMEKLGERFGVEVFTSADRVPVFRPG